MTETKAGEASKDRTDAASGAAGAGAGATSTPTPTPAFGESSLLAALPQSVDQVPQWFTGLCEKISPQEHGRPFLLLALGWLPCGALLAGLLFTILLNVVIVVAPFIAGGVMLWWCRKQLAIERLSPKERIDSILLFVAAGPMLMIEAGGLLSTLVHLVAFCGMPVVVRTLFPTNDTPKGLSEWSMRVMEIAVVPAAIFSISSGGSGLANRLLLIGCFLAARLGAPKVWALVDPHVDQHVQHPLVQKHKEGVFAVLELVIAIVIGLFVALLFPWLVIVEEQNNFLYQLLIAALGVVFLFGGFFVTDTFAPTSIERKGVAYGVIGSFAFLLLIGSLA